MTTTNSQSASTNRPPTTTQFPTTFESELASIGLTQSEYELLRLMSLLPFIKCTEIHLVTPHLDSGLESAHKRSLVAVSESGECALTRVGWVLLHVAGIVQSPGATLATA